MLPSRIYQYCPQRSVPIELVYDGKILYDNLSKETYNDEWLMAELKKRNLAVFDISYAVVGTKGNLYIDLIKDQSRV
ncbi:YetF domain-containing protein [Peribacillus frigoritolerans]|uniref:YetF domain-containing protein n=1 Tax=Peribacillus frigoritolerans TaxID=450367 RepID=UPI0035CD37B4